MHSICNIGQDTVDRTRNRLCQFYFLVLLYKASLIKKKICPRVALVLFIVLGTVGFTIILEQRSVSTKEQSSASAKGPCSASTKEQSSASAKGPSSASTKEQSSASAKGPSSASTKEQSSASAKGPSSASTKEQSSASAKEQSSRVALNLLLGGMRHVASAIISHEQTPSAVLNIWILYQVTKEPPFQII